jgi:hypothetical protein
MSHLVPLWEFNLHLSLAHQARPLYSLALVHPFFLAPSSERRLCFFFSLKGCAFLYLSSTKFGYSSTEKTGRVYHDWFEVEDSSTSTQPKSVNRCTDPLAFAVDWRVFPPRTIDSPLRSSSGRRGDCRRVIRVEKWLASKMRANLIRPSTPLVRNHATAAGPKGLYRAGANFSMGG